MVPEAMAVPEAPSRILIIRFSSMGDIVLTSPVTQRLSKIYPRAEIEFLTRAEYASIARALPGVTNVEIFQPQKGLWQLVSNFRRRRYDLLIDLHGNIRSRLVALVSDAQYVTRYDKRRFARMLMVAISAQSIFVPHTVDRYLDVLQRLNNSNIGTSAEPSLTKKDKLPRLVVDASASAEVANRLAEAGIESDVPVLGVAPGASHAPKRWLPDRFAEVADHVAEFHGMVILLIGGAEDRPIADKIAKAMRRQAVNWSGKTDLSLLPAVVKRCRILVSNDSGPMHVATAVGTPIVGIFGATHPRLGFAPLGIEDTAVTLDLPCSPCSLHGDRVCRFGTHACMEDLTSQRVINELNTRLSRT